MSSRWPDYLLRIQNATMLEADKEALREWLQQQPQLQLQGDDSSQGVLLLAGLTAIGGAADADTIADVLLHSAIRLLNADQGYLWRYVEAEHSLSLWMRVAEGHTDPLSFQALRELAESMLSAPQKPTALTDYPHAVDPSSTLWQWPVCYQERVLGVLQLEVRQAVEEVQPALVQVLSRQAAIALMRVKEVQHLRRRASMLETLRQITLTMTASLELSEVLSHILESVDRLLQGNLENAHIFLHEDGQLHFGAARFRGRPQHEPFTTPRPDGLTARVARQGRPIVVLNTASDPLFAPWPAWRGSILGLPLKIGERVVGVMNIAHRYPNAFGTEELQMLQLLADQAAIAIENARLHRLVTDQAVTDELTRLPNRRALDARLEEEIQRARRYGGHFSVMMLDLNGFKHINDHFGHPVGDRVLRQIAARMRRALRESDFLARYGGDEFAIILPQSDAEAARAVARKISDTISGTPLDLPDSSSTLLTLGIGVACYPQHGETAAELLRAADSALYVAKDHPQQNIHTFAS